MWFTKLFAAVMVALSALLPSSCSMSRSPAAQKKPPSATVVFSSQIPDHNSANTSTNSLRNHLKNDSKNRDLGPLALKNHFETRIDFGAGKSCTIRPNLLASGNLQLTMALESKSANGNIRDLSVVQVVGRTGQPVEVAVGGMNLTLTPNLASE